MNELLSKAPGDLTEKEVAELEELTSRLAKENGDLKSAAEKAAEKGVPQGNRRSWTTPIHQGSGGYEQPRSWTVPELLSKAPEDLTEKEHSI